jgi:flavin-dependent dehydrogenase
MTRRAQVLVVGGGIAGAALAARLARSGRDVLVVERRAAPHDKVCGEFIGGEAALLLNDFNIDLEALGAIRITAVRLCARDHGVAVPLPFAACSLSRRVLDEALLARASTCGAEVWRGAAVHALRRDAEAWVAALDGGGENIVAGDAFLATGKHDLRGWKRPPGRQNDLLALKQHWRLSPAQARALGSWVELFLFPGGYAGLAPIEDGLVNLCLVVRQRQFKKFDCCWDVLLDALRAAVPALRERLTAATPCGNRPLAIASIPYGFVQGHSDSPCPWRLGDQAAVIPSFAGEGISIALHSARLAAETFLTDGDCARYQARLAADLAVRIRRATLISRLLVHPAGQALAMTATQLMPGLIGVVARHTRIPQRYRARSAFGADRRFSLPVRP